jgi:hypothetical protein
LGGFHFRPLSLACFFFVNYTYKKNSSFIRTKFYSKPLKKIEVTLKQPFDSKTHNHPYYQKVNQIKTVPS